MSFRDNLLYLRAKQGMTQEQLAACLGVSRQAATKFYGAMRRFAFWLAMSAAILMLGIAAFTLFYNDNLALGAPLFDLPEQVAIALGTTFTLAGVAACVAMVLPASLERTTLRRLHPCTSLIESDNMIPSMVQVVRSIPVRLVLNSDVPINLHSDIAAAAISPQNAWSSRGCPSGYRFESHSLTAKLVMFDRLMMPTILPSCMTGAFFR